MIPALPLAAGAYAAGTILGAIVGGPWPVTALLAAMLALALWLRDPRRETVAVLIAAVALAAAGHARAAEAAAAPPPPLATMTGEHTVTGVVRDDQRLRGSLAQVDLDVERIDEGPARGIVRLRLRALDRPLLAGDRVRFTGRLEPSARADADLATTLRVRGVHALASYPAEVEVVGRTGPEWRRALEALRRGAAANIARTLPEPEAALAQGVLVGERGTLPPADAEALRATGTTHLIVVSGQNIALLLGTAIAMLTTVIARRRAALLTLSLLGPYVILVGTDPPVVRAAIMAVALTFAAISGRRTPGWVTLVYAVAAMLAVDPGLAHDVAFQLSATATAGVLLIAPPLRDAWFARVPRSAEGAAAALVEAAATATGATLAVLPVQVAAFGRLSPWSVPANILVAPLYEATFAVSALAAAIGWLAPLAQATGTVVRFVPAAFLALVRLLARLPGAEVPLALPLVAGLMGYLALGLAAWAIARRAQQGEPPGLAPGHASGFAITLALAVTAGGLWFAVLTPRADLAEVTVLDVGQGLAILVQDGGRRVLIDAGPPDGAALRAMPRAGATGGLDLLVVTHADADHAGGVQEIARRMPVADVRAARGLTIPGRVPHGDIDIGDRIRVSDRVHIEVLGPPVDTLPAALASSNDTALVLLVTIGDRRLLLPADIERGAEDWLVRSGLDLRADALVVPHHGSSTSSSRTFLDAVQPRAAVISVGARNPYDHPAPEVVARYGGVRLYRTDESGDVTLRSDGSRLWIAGQHAPMPVPTRSPRPSPTAPR